MFPPKIPRKFPQASVSSSVIDGGKAAKLMAGSALYSGRDRAMVGVVWVWMGVDVGVGVGRCPKVFSVYHTP